jgi:hypothetical protein
MHYRANRSTCFTYQSTQSPEHDWNGFPIDTRTATYSHVYEYRECSLRLRVRFTRKSDRITRMEELQCIEETLRTTVDSSEPALRQAYQ